MRRSRSPGDGNKNNNDDDDQDGGVIDFSNVLTLVNSLATGGDPFADSYNNSTNNSMLTTTGSRSGAAGGGNKNNNDVGNILLPDDDIAAAPAANNKPQAKKSGGAAAAAAVGGAVGFHNSQYDNILDEQQEEHEEEEKRRRASANNKKKPHHFSTNSDNNSMVMMAFPGNTNDDDGKITTQQILGQQLQRNPMAPSDDDDDYELHPPRGNNNINDGGNSNNDPLLLTNVDEEANERMIAAEAKQLASYSQMQGNYHTGGFGEDDDDDEEELPLGQPPQQQPQQRVPAYNNKNNNKRLMRIDSLDDDFGAGGGGDADYDNDLLGAPRQQLQQQQQQQNTDQNDAEVDEEFQQMFFGTNNLPVPKQNNNNKRRGSQVPRQHLSLGTQRSTSSTQQQQAQLTPAVALLTAGSSTHDDELSPQRVLAKFTPVQPTQQTQQQQKQSAAQRAFMQSPAPSTRRIHNNNNSGGGGGAFDNNAAAAALLMMNNAAAPAAAVGAPAAAAAAPPPGANTLRWMRKHLSNTPDALVASEFARIARFPDIDLNSVRARFRAGTTTAADTKQFAENLVCELKSQVTVTSTVPPRPPLQQVLKAAGSKNDSGMCGCMIAVPVSTKTTAALAPLAFQQGCLQLAAPPVLASASLALRKKDQAGPAVYHESQDDYVPAPELYTFEDAKLRPSHAAALKELLYGKKKNDDNNNQAGDADKSLRDYTIYPCPSWCEKQQTSKPGGLRIIYTPQQLLSATADEHREHLFHQLFLFIHHWQSASREHGGGGDKKEALSFRSVSGHPLRLDFPVEGKMMFGGLWARRRIIESIVRLTAPELLIENAYDLKLSEIFHAFPTCDSVMRRLRRQFHSMTAREIMKKFEKQLQRKLRRHQEDQEQQAPDSNSNSAKKKKQMMKEEVDDDDDPFAVKPEPDDASLRQKVKPEVKQEDDADGAGAHGGGDGDDDDDFFMDQGEDAVDIEVPVTPPGIKGNTRLLPHQRDTVAFMLAAECGLGHFGKPQLTAFPPLNRPPLQTLGKNGTKYRFYCNFALGAITAAAVGSEDELILQEREQILHHHGSARRRFRRPNKNNNNTNNNDEDDDPFAQADFDFQDPNVPLPKRVSILPRRGGILANELGSGKTLCLLSTVLLNPKPGPAEILDYSKGCDGVSKLYRVSLPWDYAQRQQQKQQRKQRAKKQQQQRIKKENDDDDDDGDGEDEDDREETRLLDEQAHAEKVFLDNIHSRLHIKATLYVCPVSLVSQIENEVLERCSDTVKILRWHGTARRNFTYADLANADLIVTTAETLNADLQSCAKADALLSRFGQGRNHAGIFTVTQHGATKAEADALGAEVDQTARAHRRIFGNALKKLLDCPEIDPADRAYLNNSDTFLKRLAECDMGSQKCVQDQANVSLSRLRFRRVIVDEYHKYQSGTLPRLDSDFYWLVSATPLHDAGTYASMSPHFGVLSHCTSGLDILTEQQQQQQLLQQQPQFKQDEIVPSGFTTTDRIAKAVTEVEKRCSTMFDKLGEVLVTKPDAGPGADNPLGIDVFAPGVPGPYTPGEGTGGIKSIALTWARAAIIGRHLVRQKACKMLLDIKVEEKRVFVKLTKAEQAKYRQTLRAIQESVAGKHHHKDFFKKIGTVVAQINRLRQACTDPCRYYIAGNNFNNEEEVQIRDDPLDALRNDNQLVTIVPAHVVAHRLYPACFSIPPQCPNHPDSKSDQWAFLDVFKTCDSGCNNLLVMLRDRADKSGEDQQKLQQMAATLAATQQQQQEEAPDGDGDEEAILNEEDDWPMCPICIQVIPKNEVILLACSHFMCRTCVDDSCGQASTNAQQQGAGGFAAGLVEKSSTLTACPTCRHPGSLTMKKVLLDFSYVEREWRLQREYKRKHFSSVKKINNGDPKLEVGEDDDGVARSLKREFGYGGDDDDDVSSDDSYHNTPRKRGDGEVDEDADLYTESDTDGDDDAIRAAAGEDNADGLDGGVPENNNNNNNNDNAALRFQRFEDEDDDDDGDGDPRGRGFDKKKPGGKHRTPSKFKEIVRILRRHPNEKFLIFSSFPATVTAVGEVLAKKSLPAVIIDGSTSLNARAKRISSFQNDDQVRACVISSRTGNAGLNFHAAHHVIFVEPAPSPEVDAQTIGRVARIGQQSSVVTIHRLFAQGTIDERIHDTVQKKKLSLAGGMRSERAKRRVMRKLFLLLWGPVDGAIKANNFGFGDASSSDIVQCTVRGSCCDGRLFCCAGGPCEKTPGQNPKRPSVCIRKVFFLGKSCTLKRAKLQIADLKRPAGRGAAGRRPW